MKKAADIDEYIASFPDDIAGILETVRKTVSAAAPKATEAIKYDMPSFVLNGNLVHFAAFNNHLGLYPAPTGDPEFNERLKPYKTGKGSIRFSYNEPLPVKLITAIVKARVKQLAAKDKP